MRSRPHMVAIAVVFAAVLTTVQGAAATDAQAPAVDPSKIGDVGIADVSVLEDNFARLEAILENTGALGVYVRDMRQV